MYKQIETEIILLKIIKDLATKKVYYYFK